MATINVGMNGTLKGISSENQLLELCSRIRTWEADTNINVKGKNNVKVAINLQTYVATINITLPIGFVISPNGSITTTAIPYLSNTGYVAATDGTFKSVTPESCLLEIINFMQILEASASSNPTNANNVTATFDSDSNVFTGTITLNIENTIDNDGNVVIHAIEYLKD